MNRFYQSFAIISVILFFEACNHVTYIPRSKASVRRAAPSILIFEKIVDFRVEQNGWPVSVADLTSKGEKYYHVFNNFPYTGTEFKIIDSNRMVFYFYGHIQDIDDYNTYKKVNLNSYAGRVRFFKDNNKFIWRLKMY